jgi:hypothetical protein
MTSNIYLIPKDLIEKICKVLEESRQSDAALAIMQNHPKELGPSHVAATGGGCEAYFINASWGSMRLLVVWTDNGGGDLPGANDWMVSVQLGDHISEDPILKLDSEGSCDVQPRVAIGDIESSIVPAPGMTMRDLTLAGRLARDILNEALSHPEMSQCTNFGDLHDICDANCLAGACEEGHFIHGEIREHEILNHAQELVNAALFKKNG